MHAEICHCIAAVFDVRENLPAAFLRTVRSVVPARRRRNGRGFPGQLRRTDGQPAACQLARTEVGSVPGLATASKLPKSERDTKRKS